MKKIFIGLLFLAKAATAQLDPEPALRAYYPFNGNANDASGNNNNPVFNNATLTADRFGRPNSAYHFNGIDNFMRIPNSRTLNLKNMITLSVWVRPTGFYHDYCHASSILTKGGGNYLPGDYALRFDDALITSGMGCSEIVADTLHQNFRGTGTVLVPYSPYIEKNKWYSVIYTNDGTSARLYVNCELKYTVPFRETFTNNDDLFLGKTNDPFFNFWMNADLDDVRIYDRALTENEIASLCIKDPDTVAVKKAEPVPEVKIEPRKNELMRQIIVDHDSVTVTLYDNGEIDGDSVTLIYRDSVIATHKMLTDKPLTYKIKIQPGNSSNVLIMYAENMGSIPPNTALMIIYDGEKRYEVNMRSTENTNGTVSFKLRE
jgi:hypothetical protein